MQCPVWHMWAFTTTHPHYTLYHLCCWMDRWPTHCYIYISRSCQLPDAPCHGPTSHKSLCHTVRDLLLFHHRCTLCSISWLLFIFKLPVFTVEKKEVFPQSSDLASRFSLITLCLFLQCIFTSSHLASHSCFTLYFCCALHLHLTLFCIASPYSPTIFTCHELISTTPRDNPLPPDHTLKASLGLYFDRAL